MSSATSERLAKTSRMDLCVEDDRKAAYGEAARQNGQSPTLHPSPPAGFYTLSGVSVGRDTIGGGWLKCNASAQVPAVLLGVLGVDSRYQGSGLGRMLLHDAFPPGRSPLPTRTA